MTFSDDFKTTKSTDTGAPNYPVVFGITLTPLVGGILAGLAGVGIALYIWNNSVSKVISDKETKALDLENKKSQLAQLKSGEMERTLQTLEVEFQKEQALEPQVLSMFSDEKSLDTLLLDLYNLIQGNQVQLNTYQPEATIEEITDGSLGDLVNGRLKRKVINLEIEGTFGQTLAVIQDIERLQPLLLIKDFNSAVIPEELVYVYENGQLDSNGEVRLKTNFKIEAILPAAPQPTPPPEEEAAKK